MMWFRPDNIPMRETNRRCPRCGEKMGTFLDATMGDLIQVYQCIRCGYREWSSSLDDKEEKTSGVGACSEE